MANKINYDLLMQTLAKNNKGKKLLLHTCCAPCLTYPLEILKDCFDITVFYYNSNITDRTEYLKRGNVLKNYLEKYSPQTQMIEGAYEPEKFYELSRGRESDKEGGGRCFLCYKLRLEESAKIAKINGYDFFGTVLSVSPYKNTDAINSIGAEIEKSAQVSFLYSDFKKREGYKKSVAFSGERQLYRQSYCGCEYSLIEK